MPALGPPAWRLAACAPRDACPATLTPRDPDAPRPRDPATPRPCPATLPPCGGPARTGAFDGKPRRALRIFHVRSFSAAFLGKSGRAGPVFQWTCGRRLGGGPSTRDCCCITRQTPRALQVRSRNARQSCRLRHAPRGAPGLPRNAGPRRSGSQPNEPAAQVPQDMQRRASNRAVDSSSPLTTSSKFDVRRTASRCGLMVLGASE